MIHFSCKTCETKFRVKEELSGKKTNCPKCKSPITIPNSRDSNHEYNPDVRQTPKTSNPENRELAKNRDTNANNTNTASENPTYRIPKLAYIIATIISLVLFTSLILIVFLLPNKGETVFDKPEGDKSFETESKTANTPSDLVKRYIESSSEEKIGYILEPSTCKNLMPSFYKAVNTNSISPKVRFVKLKNPAIEISIDHMRYCTPIVEENGETHESLPIPIVNTGSRGLKIDWLYYHRDYLLKHGLYIGRIGGMDTIPSVNSDQLEVTPERYRGKKVRILNATFIGFSTTFITSIPGVTIADDGRMTVYREKEYEKWSGISVTDHKGSIITKILFEKEKFLDLFMSIEGLQKINLIGVVQRLEVGSGDGIVVIDAEKIEDLEKRYIFPE